MKCRIWLIVLGVLCWLTAPNSTFAQGTAFTYQGNLNLNGATTSGVYDFQFKLHPALGLTNQVANTITNTAVAVTNGLFTTVVDFSYTFPISPLYLEIGVRPNGSTGAFTALAPYQLITSAPYAVQALTAANFNGTISDAQLSSNIVTLTNTVTFTNQVVFSQAIGGFNGMFNGVTAGTNTGTFIGNGGLITNLNITNLVGVVQSNPNFQLVQAGTQQAVVANNYLTTNSASVTLLLPATGVTAGSTLRFSGSGANGWTIGQTAGQSIIVSPLGLPAGQNWSSNSMASQEWQTLASSSDGLRLIAGYGGLGFIYYSADGGVTWTKSDAPGLNWKGLASSVDGLHMLAAPSGGAVGGYVFTSTNGGVHWVGQINGLLNTSYSCAASSADGINLAVAVGSGSGAIYTSNNGGTNWISRTNGQNWTGIASSASGTTLAACASGFAPLYISKNSGVTWATNGPFGSYSAIACSADGNKIVATINGGAIYTSGDAGTTWTARTTNNAWTCVTSSASGVNLAAASSLGYLYTSSDSGQTWIIRTNSFGSLTKAWDAVTSSGDGSRLVAAVNNGTLYTSIAATTVGTNGVLMGKQYSSVELQYIGNGQWMPLAFSGVFTVF
ncbi:MAG TPA: sialidase family protein [Verrucomicrobiae bacterium]|jgi:hypothetical protein|nr:sialidase family protein [Verrucomicrobiae bacterium]